MIIAPTWSNPEGETAGYIHERELLLPTSFSETPPSQSSRQSSGSSTLVPTHPFSSSLLPCKLDHPGSYTALQKIHSSNGLGPAGGGCVSPLICPPFHKSLGII